MAVTFLLDTNACIRLLNTRSASLAEKLKATSPQYIRLCSVVQAELVFGAYKSQKPAQNLALIQRFSSQFESVPFDEKCLDTYGRIRAELERKGTPIGPLDTMIAAIAVAHGLALVTHNTKEFSRVQGLTIEDWE